MKRLPLSNAEEESVFQRMDDACDACAAGLKPHILARFAAAGQRMDRPSVALAFAYNSPTALRVAFKPRMDALSQSVASIPPAVQKARAPKLTRSEAEFIDGALDEGLELGLEALPAKIRPRVDVEAARKVARRRLSRGIFRQNMAAFEESMRGLDRIVNAAQDPTLAVLRDVDRLGSMFGLNAKQAEIIVRETRELVGYHRKPTQKQLDAVRRAMARRIRQALEARAEMLGQTIAQEVIATAQQALFEQARKQGLLKDEVHLKEWVTRRDERVCPRCDAFDGKRVPVDEMFVSDDGEKAYQPGIHPRCRCRTRLVTVRAATRQTRRRAA